jgi:hypothetical protein
LYYHAIELYLKAFLRQKGHSVAELSAKFGHKTDKLGARAKECGLAFDDEDEGVFTTMGNTDAVIRSRYIRTGPATWPTFEALDATCEHLHHQVAVTLRLNIRLSVCL